MSLRPDIDKMRAHGMAKTSFYVLAAPRKLATYEKRILTDILRLHGYLLIGSKRPILELLRMTYLNIELDDYAFQSGQMILFISNLNLKEVRTFVNCFIGGRYPKPGIVAPQTLMHPAGIVENTSVNAGAMALFLQNLGHAACLKNGKVLLQKPCIVFEQGDVLNLNQCELARLLFQRLPEYKLRVTHMWTATGGLSILEPKRLPLMKRVRQCGSLDSAAVCKEENDSDCETETGWKAIKRKAQETQQDRIFLEEKNMEDKIKQEPMDDLQSTKPGEDEIVNGKIKQEWISDTDFTKDIW